MLSALRLCLVVIAVRPVAWLLISRRTFGSERLPRQGPAIVAANHNSHLDTVLLLSLFPLRSLHLVKSVAAADHFFGSPLLSWLFHHIVGTVPVVRGRQRRGVDPLGSCRGALERGEILLIFPEGTRGDAETMSPLKSGIVRLSKAFPAAPVIPVFIRGAGKVLPRHARIPMPANCSVMVGAPLDTAGTRSAILERLRLTFAELHDAARSCDGSLTCAAA